MNSLDFFKEITKIPRPSGHEEKIREFLIGKAKEQGWSYKVDDAGNLLVSVPGKGAQAGKPLLMLQNHMDMVTAKEDGVTIDFMKEGLTIYEEDGFLKAKGTTLGADNGAGIALAFYCGMLDNHPPLELLFTVDEEAGLNGARALKPGFFTADRAINLDSHEDGVFTVGCAGGGQVDYKIRADEDKSFSKDFAVRFEVADLMGGHSGADIHEKRASAAVMLASQLKAWRDAGFDFRLCDINVGLFHNAIARSGYVVAAFKNQDDAKKASETVLDQIKDFPLEKHFKQKTALVKADKVMTAEVTKQVIDLTTHLKHGVLNWSREFEGIVETSANLAIIKLNGGYIEVCYSFRSFIDDEVVRIQKENADYGRKLGAEANPDQPYPGWAPAKENPLADKLISIYEKFTGKKAHVAPVHAGLECGYLKKVNPKLLAVSIGPVIFDLHAPSERLDIASMPRTEALLKETLANI
jgi:dipeptidase D